MNIKTKHYGSSGGSPASSIELTVSSWGGESKISEDVTDLNGNIDKEFIQQLRDIADELEEQNDKINKPCN